MKKLTLFLLSFVSLSVFAQDNFKNYVGKYKFESAPIEEVIVSIKDGKLYGEAVGQGVAELAKTETTDVFDVLGYKGKATFIRNEQKNVDKITLIIEGANMDGVRQIPAQSDYVGSYTFESAPFEKINVSIEEGKLMIEAEGVGKGGIDATSNLDEFYQRDYNSSIIFVRDAANAIKSMSVSVQGSILEGKKVK